MDFTEKLKIEEILDMCVEYETGERKRKFVRGSIVDRNLSILSLTIVKKGEQEIPGLTDNVIPRRLGPKRASKTRKLFNLSKEDNVCQYVNKRRQAEKNRQAAAKYAKIIAQRQFVILKFNLKNIMGFEI